jgi:hypothetical protein
VPIARWTSGISRISVDIRKPSQYAPSVIRQAAHAFVGFLTLTGGVLAFYTMQPALLWVEPVLNVGVIPPCITHERGLAIRNLNPLKDVDVKDVSASCVCISVNSEGGPQARKDLIPFSIRLQKYEERISAEIRILDSRGSVHRVLVIGEVERPFAGWPTAACAKVDGQSIIIPCTTSLLEHIGAAFLEAPRGVVTGECIPEAGLIEFPGGDPKSLDGSATLWLIGRATEPAWEWRGQVFTEICDPNRTGEANTQQGETP